MNTINFSKLKTATKKNLQELLGTTGKLIIREGGHRQPVFVLSAYKAELAEPEKPPDTGLETKVTELTAQLAEKDATIVTLEAEKADLAEKVQPPEAVAELAEKIAFAEKLDAIVQNDDRAGMVELITRIGYGDLLRTEPAALEEAPVAEVAETEPPAAEPPKEKTLLQKIAELGARKTTGHAAIIEDIHNNLVNGNRRDMVKQIDEYGRYDFWSDYKDYLNQTYGRDEGGRGGQGNAWDYFTDACISYFRIKAR